MNKHILLAMKWLDDKDSVSKKELKDNANDAAAAYANACAYAYADAGADAYAYAYANAVAAHAAAYADTEKWVNIYFERTGENKQDYIDAIAKGKDKTKSPQPKKMKVEYVKVDKNGKGGKFWECARDLSENINLIYADKNGASTVETNDSLLSLYKRNLLWRKVETEITWQDEVMEHINSSEWLDSDFYLSMIDSGNDLERDDFVAMCRVVVNAVDNK